MNEQKVSASGESAPRPSADEIVQAITNAYDSLPPFSMRIDSDSWSEGQRSLVYSAELRMEADRIDLITTNYVVQAGVTRPFRMGRSVWTGEQYVTRGAYHKTADPSNPTPIRPRASNQKERADGIATFPASAPYLRGVYVLAGPIEEIGTILNQAFDVSMEEDMDEVGGHACYVVEASTRWGDFKLWVDPAYGFNIRRALIEKSEGHIYDGKTLPANFIAYRSGARPVIQQINFELKEVEIEKIGDYHVLVAGELWITIVYADGKRDERYFAAKRSEIVWNPDFEKMGAFVMDEIPEGSHLSFDDGVRPGVAEWRKGKAVPVRRPTPTPGRRPIS